MQPLWIPRSPAPPSRPPPHSQPLPPSPLATLIYKIRSPRAPPVHTAPHPSFPRIQSSRTLTSYPYNPTSPVPHSSCRIPPSSPTSPPMPTHWLAPPLPSRWPLGCPRPPPPHPAAPRSPAPMDAESIGTPATPPRAPQRGHRRSEPPPEPSAAAAHGAAPGRAAGRPAGGAGGSAQGPAARGAAAAHPLSAQHRPPPPEPRALQGGTAGVRANPRTKQSWHLSMETQWGHSPPRRRAGARLTVGPADAPLDLFLRQAAGVDVLPLLWDLRVLLSPSCIPRSLPNPHPKE